MRLATATPLSGARPFGTWRVHLFFRHYTKSSEVLCTVLCTVRPFSPKKEGTHDAVSPCLFRSSGGRIRTSDLRVMSPDRSLFTSAVLFKTSSSPKDLRPQGVSLDDTYVAHVFQNLMYGSMYAGAPARATARSILVWATKGIGQISARPR